MPLTPSQIFLAGLVTVVFIVTRTSFSDQRMTEVPSTKVFSQLLSIHFVVDSPADLPVAIDIVISSASRTGIDSPADSPIAVDIDFSQASRTLARVC